MRLEAIELRWLDLAMRQPIGTAAGAHRRRPVAFVRVVTDEADGWGECGALAGGTSVDPSLEEVWRLLVDVGCTRVEDAVLARGGELPPAAQVAQLFDAGPAGRLAGAALEMAVLDAELRSAEACWVDRLEIRPEVVDRGVPVGALVGIPDDHRLETLVASVARLVAGGVARVRMKIQPGWDVEAVKAVRNAFPDLALHVDANASYRIGTDGVDRAERLAELDRFQLACVEQPLPASDLVSLAALAAKLETPVCLDESLTSPRRLTDAIRYGACEVACLKPPRLGGLLAARRALEICHRAEVPAFVGGLFETGLGRSAHATLAGLPGSTLPGDLSDPDGYLAENPVPYLDIVDGRVQLHRGPGVAPARDVAAMAKVTAVVERRRIGS